MHHDPNPRFWAWRHRSLCLLHCMLALEERQSKRERWGTRYTSEWAFRLHAAAHCQPAAMAASTSCDACSNHQMQKSLLVSECYSEIAYICSAVIVELPNQHKGSLECTRDWDTLGWLALQSQKLFCTHALYQAAHSQSRDTRA